MIIFDGDMVAYQHPDRGAVRGTVLDAQVRDGRVLVLDMAPGSGREWWPVAQLEVLPREIEGSWGMATPPSAPTDGVSITLRASPGDEPCPECDGTGEDEDQEGDEFVRDGDCVWCHGSGRRLRPIPVQVLAAVLGGAR